MTTYNMTGYQELPKQTKVQDVAKEHRSLKIESSQWSKEEMQFLSEVETLCDTKKRIHGNKAHIYGRKLKWLRFTVNFTSSALGVCGFATFLTRLVGGQLDWSVAIVGSLNLLAGFSGAIGDSFKWDEKQNLHDRAADKYGTISTDVRLCRITPGLDRKDCELATMRIGNMLSVANADAPWVSNSGLEPEKKNTHHRWNRLNRMEKSESE
jgi:hypothetical protein